MIPCFLAATICFICAFVAAPPVDIDGIREPVSLDPCIWGNNIISGAVVPSSKRHRSPFLSNLGSWLSLDEWLYNGGPYQLVIFHFLIGIFCYMGREWELSYRLRYAPLDLCGIQQHLLPQPLLYFSYTPLVKDLLADGMPPWHFRHLSTLCLVFQAEHNILMHPFHMLGVAGVFGGGSLQRYAREFGYI